jgi:hypothetical protein
MAGGCQLPAWATRRLPRQLASTMQPCLSPFTVHDRMQQLTVRRSAAVAAGTAGTVSTDSPTFFL